MIWAPLAERKRFLNVCHKKSPNTHVQSSRVSRKQATLPYATNDYKQMRLRVVAGSCIPATWRPDIDDDLRLEVLVLRGSSWLGLRTKLGINTGALGESGETRLINEV
jgi:hypothetical protein